MLTSSRNSWERLRHGVGMLQPRQIDADQMSAIRAADPDIRWHQGRSAGSDAVFGCLNGGWLGADRKGAHLQSGQLWDMVNDTLAVYALLGMSPVIRPNFRKRASWPASRRSVSDSLGSNTSVVSLAPPSPNG